jgi:hypothetical protein
MTVAVHLWTGNLHVVSVDGKIVGNPMPLWLANLVAEILRRPLS